MVTVSYLHLEKSVKEHVEAGNDLSAVNKIILAMSEGTPIVEVADLLLAALGTARDAGPVGTLFSWIVSREDISSALVEEGHEATDENIQKVIDNNAAAGWMECIGNANSDALQTLIWNTFPEEGDDVAV